MTTKQKNIFFICQTVDLNDSIQATVARWILSLSKKSSIAHINVLALKTGEFPANPKISLTKIGSGNKLKTLISFYKKILREAFRKKIDFFFICQGGPYPLLLLPLKILLKIPIYQWKAHNYISPSMKFYATVCDDKIFTSTHAAFPLESPKVCPVGQGVETDLFSPKKLEKEFDLVSVGRISAVKQLEKIVTALSICHKDFNAQYKLDLFGPILPADESYKEGLERLITSLGLTSYVTFHGAINQSQLPIILNKSRLYVNFCKGALNRAVAEAMACELPIITTNISTSEILTPHIKEIVFAPNDDAKKQAEIMHHVVSLNKEDSSQLGKELREIIVKGHNIDALMDKILSHIDS